MLKPWCMLKKTTKPLGPFGAMPQEPWHPGKGAKLDQDIHLKCQEVRTHANYKTTRTWENFNNQGTKMILLSNKLHIIANNSKSFANKSKSKIRNNLGLWRHIFQKGVWNPRLLRSPPFPKIAHYVSNISLVTEMQLWVQ